MTEFIKNNEDENIEPSGMCGKFAMCLAILLAIMLAFGA